MMADIHPREPAFIRCYCTAVTREQVLAAIRTYGCRTVDDLRERTGACSGCASCRPELQALLDGTRPQEPPPP